jgi:hypothetical protein
VETTTFLRRTIMAQQNSYAGFVASLETTSICIVDDEGSTIWCGSCPTDAAKIAGEIRLRALGVVRVGLETGPMWRAFSRSPGWLGPSVMSVTPYQVRAVRKRLIDKTGTNDAWWVAQTVRMAWMQPPPVWFKKSSLSDFHSSFMLVLLWLSVVTVAATSSLIATIKERDHRHLVLENGMEAMAVVRGSPSTESVTLEWTDASGRLRTAVAPALKSYTSWIRERTDLSEESVSIKYLGDFEPVILPQVAELEEDSSRWITMLTGLWVVTGSYWMAHIIMFLARRMRKRASTAK